MPLQFLIAMWGAWIGLGIIVASEALGTSCLGARESYARQAPTRISRGTILNRRSPLSGK